MSFFIKLEIEGKKYVAYPEQSEGEKKRSLRPKQGDCIYAIRCNKKDVGEYVWNEDSSMTNWYELGDVSTDRKVIERELAYRQALQRVKEWIYEHDAGKEWKWGEENYIIKYLTKNYKFVPDFWMQDKYFSPFGYLKSAEACGQLIQEMDSDLRIIFNV